MKPLRVSCTLWMKLLICVCIVYYGSRAVESWNEMVNLFLLIPSVIFVAWGVHFFFTHGTIEMTDQTVRLFTVIGRYEIAWDEVKSIQSENSTIVLIGEDKKLVIPGTGAWSGPDKEQMVRLYDGQVSSRFIPITETWKAAFQLSRGTRAKS